MIIGLNIRVYRRKRIGLGFNNGDTLSAKLRRKAIHTGWPFFIPEIREWWDEEPTVILKRVRQIRRSEFEQQSWPEGRGAGKHRVIPPSPPN